MYPYETYCEYDTSISSRHYDKFGLLPFLLAGPFVYSPNTHLAVIERCFVLDYRKNVVEETLCSPTEIITQMEDVACS